MVKYEKKDHFTQKVIFSFCTKIVVQVIKLANCFYYFIDSRHLVYGLYSVLINQKALKTYISNQWITL